MPNAVIVDDDADFAEAIQAVVESQGFAVSRAATLAEALELLSKQAPDLVFVDLSLPDGEGLSLLEPLAEYPSTEVVVVTGNASIGTAVAALREGAADYLTKPVDVERLRGILANVARRRELVEEVETLRTELRGLGRFGPLIGASAAMQSVYDRIARVAPSGAAVLVTGESGTGKELVASTIHQLSRRRKHAFVAVNCGAISPQLIESELFGHERGGFTGADRSHKGYFERAHGGTLFLDEIAEMPLELQVRLLRVLETGKVTRIGGEREVPIDIRIIAATNRSPNSALEEGKLRADLLYRLRGFPIELPPLRARDEDVVVLADHFLALLNKAEGAEKRLGRGARALLKKYSWPGNVRELQNVVQTGFLLADDEIEPTHLPQGVQQGSAGAPATSEGPMLQVRIGARIDQVERRLILATLAAFEGKKEPTASALGISLKTLYNRLNQYKPADEDSPDPD
jgi:DNA-binding NtrC family response regulator